jgi:hypothetical protein
MPSVNSQTANVNPVSLTTSSTSIASATSGRKGLIISNETTGIVYVLFGSGTASSTNHTLALAANAVYEHAYGTSGYSGPLTAVAVTAGPVFVTTW